MKLKRKEGWQMWVDLYEDHVIKIPKTRKEVTRTVKKYLEYLGKSHETKETVDRVFKDVTNSIKIIKRSKMPKKYFAYPEFLEKGQLKQKRVISIDKKLLELIKKKKIAEAKKLIDKFFKFIHKMWEYGIHEKPLKFNTNFGLIKNKVVLIDLFELTTNKAKVKKHIGKKSWRKKEEGYIHSLPKILVDYFIEQADKKITPKNLDKYWKRKLK